MKRNFYTKYFWPNFVRHKKKTQGNKWKKAKKKTAKFKVKSQHWFSTLVTNHYNYSCTDNLQQKLLVRFAPYQRRLNVVRLKNLICLWQRGWKNILKVLTLTKVEILFQAMMRRCITIYELSCMENDFGIFQSRKIVKTYNKSYNRIFKIYLVFIGWYSFFPKMFLTISKSTHICTSNKENLIAIFQSLFTILSYRILPKIKLFHFLYT